MYETFYKLREEPFRLSPDHRFSSRHESYARAADYLRYGVERAEGIVMITGAPGTGKSTLVGDLIDGISARVLVANLVITQLESDDLLRATAYRFGLRIEGRDKATVLHLIEDFLIQQTEAERRVLLVVDEAQDLPAGALEELRLLTNLQLRSRPLLQVFLLGQQGLLDVVNDPSMEQLQQRIIAASHLQPLDVDETRIYVESRLEHAGWQGDPQITDDAFTLIHRFSHGIPRRINLLCSRLLLYGSVDEKHELNGADVHSVIDDLRRESLIRDDTPPDTRSGTQNNTQPRKAAGQVSDLRPLPGNAAKPPPAPPPRAETPSQPQPKEAERPAPAEEHPSSESRLKDRLQEVKPVEAGNSQQPQSQPPAQPKTQSAPAPRHHHERPATPAPSSASKARTPRPQSPPQRQVSQTVRRDPAFPGAPGRNGGTPPSATDTKQTAARPAPGNSHDPNAAPPPVQPPPHRPALRPPAQSAPAPAPEPSRTVAESPPAPRKTPDNPPRGRRPSSEQRPTPSLFADARADRLDLDDDDLYSDPDEAENPGYGRWLVGLLIALVVLGAFYVLNPTEGRQIIGALGGWLSGLFGNFSSAGPA